MYGIMREDRQWYAGTSDHRPRFGSVPAEYKTEKEAEDRIKAFEKTEPRSYFEVIPLAEKRGGNGD